jgi:hypothetical protein
MRCTRCQAEVAEEQEVCRACGYHVNSREPVPSPTSSPGVSAQEDLAASSVGGGALKPASGFRRTLSTELAEKQTELHTALK